MRRNSNLRAGFAVLPALTRLGKPFLPEDTGVQGSGPAELREPSEGEKDFPSAPLVSLVNRSCLSSLSPLTPSPRNFFSPQVAVIAPLFGKIWGYRQEQG